MDEPVSVTGSSHETVGRLHGDCADLVVPEVLRDLEGEGQRLLVKGAFHLERVEDGRHLVGRELDVDDRTDHTYDAADAAWLGRFVSDLRWSRSWFSLPC